MSRTGCEATRDRWRFAPASPGVGVASRALLCALGAIVMLGAPLFSARAAEQAPAAISLEVMLSHISSEPGPIDKRAARLDAKLRKEFRYQSLRVLDEKTMRLGINDVGSMKLPTGRKLRVTPIVIDARGALLAVDLEGSAKADLRLKPGHLIIIGAQSYQGGKLVISLYPDF